ncbi:CPBP family intramembrane glutamic endopeptidase [Roseateles chitosanitabidus]|uniref:CPBP family intramembrane glutamic endopeptidase n=1 Tax=Roseateles chitosanitabidus TaxID=65048 RepID=UPI00082ABBE2|nr:type II CAAX endopeptidase family protein [Roseateles chitosanitabidus]
MTLSLRNERAQVRDGWKSLFFILAAMACFVIVGVVGHSLPASVKPFAPSAILITVMGLAITYGATRLEGSRVADLGLRLDGRFLRESVLGVLAGAAMIGVSAAAVMLWADVRLSPMAGPTWAVELKLVATFLGGALFEELLFRGFAFQRALRGMGVWPATVLFGLLFCIAHLPGNLEVGPALLATAMANLFANGVLQTVLYLRTGSLALPIGLHFGWNLLQQSLGFGVSGISSHQAWFQVHFGQQPTWLSGGEFGLEASIFALVLQAALIVLLVATGRRALAARPASPVPSQGLSHATHNVA